MTLKVDLEALAHDAKLWGGASDVLADAVTTLDGLHLDSYVFSFAGGEAHTAYAQVLSFVRKYVHDGSTQTQNGHDTLLKVRQDFRDTDESQVDKYKTKWVPQ